LAALRANERLTMHSKWFGSVPIGPKICITPAAGAHSRWLSEAKLLIRQKFL
jgi:hypothetical protein